jgi:hypothetical protein
LQFSLQHDSAFALLMLNNFKLGRVTKNKMSEHKVKLKFFIAMQIYLFNSLKSKLK